MNTHADKTQDNKSQSVANQVSQKPIDSTSTFQFVDNRPEAIAQRKLQKMANSSPKVKQLRAFQDMVNNSSQAQQITQLKSMIDGYSTNPFQEMSRPTSKDSTAVLQLHNGGVPLPGRRKRRRMAQEEEMAAMDAENGEWENSRDSEEADPTVNPFAALAEEEDGELAEEEAVADQAKTLAPTIEALKAAGNNVPKIKELLAGYDENIAGQMSRSWRTNRKYASIGDLERAAKSKLGIADEVTSSASSSSSLPSKSSTSSSASSSSSSGLSKAERRKKNQAARGTPLTLTAPDVGGYLNTLPTPTHAVFNDIVIFTLSNNGDYKEVHVHRNAARVVIQISKKQIGQQGNGPAVPAGTPLYVAAVAEAAKY
jgi:hypothetical protein